MCQDFKGGDLANLPLDSDDSILETSTLDKAVIPFLSCGDLSGWNESGFAVMDADMSYPISEDQYVAPVAPPILPPHEAQKNHEKNGSTIS